MIVEQILPPPYTAPPQEGGLSALWWLEFLESRNMLNIVLTLTFWTMLTHNIAAKNSLRVAGVSDALWFLVLYRLRHWILLRFMMIY